MDCLFDVAKCFLKPLAAGNPVVFVTYILAGILSIFSHVSIDNCSIFLSGCKDIILFIAAEIAKSTTPELIVRPILRDIPLNVETIVESLDLKPKTKGYCCCPKCYCCYPLDDYPARCTNREAPDSGECGRTLLHHMSRGGKLHSYAARRYLYHDLKSWLGELLCRPGMEKQLDRKVLRPGEDNPVEMRNIFDGRILRNFKGNDNKTFLNGGKRGEGRYVFALNMDSFNPFYNKHGGGTASCGAIYLVCLNLPPHLRYRVENMFLVSIIPGPNHPSLTQINHLLSPLVDDFLQLWNPGVYYSRTSQYSTGRHVRCALVPVICDLPAARHVISVATVGCYQRI
jgi:hypothetical protein